MKCGNNLLAESDIGLTCNACKETSGFIQVTEENIGKIPYPTHLHQYDQDFDPNVCNDSPGFCPCGYFITHPTNEPCNIIETTTVKEPIDTTNCHCKAELCPCGAYTAHRVFDPCNAILAGDQNDTHNPL